MNKRKKSVKKWLPFLEILDEGIIKLKNNSYLKMLKITPINFNLKSNLEKEAILNSYKIFLKTCNFNFQILIQSNKENLSAHISKIKNKKKENNNISKLSKNYIEYIEKMNQEKKSSSKKFFILLNIPNENKNNKKNPEKEQLIINNLSEQYFKIKECLCRCGNNVIEIKEKNEIKNVLYSFFNKRKNLNNN